jgi:hypothetical protein
VGALFCNNRVNGLVKSPLAFLWYVLLIYSVAGGFTLLGEKEPGAWYRFIGFHLGLTAMLGIVLGFLLL